MFCPQKGSQVARPQSLLYGGALLSAGAPTAFLRRQWHGLAEGWRHRCGDRFYIGEVVYRGETFAPFID
jgi:hypothetical protein